MTDFAAQAVVSLIFGAKTSAAPFLKAKTMGFSNIFSKFIQVVWYHSYWTKCLSQKLAATLYITVAHDNSKTVWSLFDLSNAINSVCKHIYKVFNSKNWLVHPIDVKKSSYHIKDCKGCYFQCFQPGNFQNVNSQKWVTVANSIIVQNSPFWLENCKKVGNTDIFSVGTENRPTLH